MGIGLVRMLLLGESIDVIKAIVWSLVTIAMVIVSFLLLMKLKRWMQEADDEPVDAGFSLSDLKRLHREGKISNEEFERAYGKMIGAARAMTEKLPDPLAGSRKRAGEQPPDIPSP